jgi:hypothetical protein
MANRQQIELANVDGAHPVTRDTDGRSWLFPLSSHETLEHPPRGLGTSDPSSFIYKTNLTFLFVFLVFFCRTCTVARGLSRFQPAPFVPLCFFLSNLQIAGQLHHHIRAFLCVIYYKLKNKQGRLHKKIKRFLRQTDYPPLA